MRFRGDDVSTLIRRRREALAVAALLLIALALRVYQANWDQGHLYHPDERFILMSAAGVGMSWPPNLGQMFSPNGSLIPQDYSYSYGTFALYLLRLVAWFLAGLSHVLPLVFSGFRNLDDLGNLRLVGRPISAIFDTGTVFLVYWIGRKLYGRRVAFLAAGFVTFSVLDIQLSHFYATDTLMTGLVVGAVAFSVAYLKSGKTSDAIWAGVFAGLALATKASAAVVLAPVVAAHLLRWFSSDENRQRLRLRLPDAVQLGDGIWLLWVAVASASAAFVIAEPFAVIDFRHFLGGVLEQSSMVRGIADLPYTRQYFGRPPYLYFFQQLVLFGVGVPLGLAMLAGWLYLIVRNVFRPSRYDLVLLAYVVPYFAITGDFWAKFLRYLLPIAPFLALFAALMLVRAFDLVRGWRLSLHPEEAGAPEAAPEVVLLPPEPADELAWENLDLGELVEFDGPAEPAGVEGLTQTVVSPVADEGLAAVASVALEPEAQRWLELKGLSFGLLEAEASVSVALDPETERWLELKGLSFEALEVDEPLEVDTAGPSVAPPNGHLPTTTPNGHTDWIAVQLDDEDLDPAPVPVPVPGWLAANATGRRLLGSRWPTRVVAGVTAIVLLFSAFYALAYDHIYASTTTPVLGSEWLYQNAPRGSVLATEHWEEGMPVPIDGPPPNNADIAGFRNVTMPMYDDDNQQKLETIVSNLEQANYIVFFSNRLYNTVPRIPARYPMSQRYYEKLFGEQLGFKLVDVAARYPNLLGVAFVDDTLNDAGLPTPALLQTYRPAPITINLGHADESFSVYDHQKVLIFQKVQNLTPDQYRALIGPPAGPEQLQAAQSGALGQQYKSLMLTQAQAAVVQAGGTFRDLFNRTDVSNQAPLLVWILLVAIIGLAGVPFGFLTFRWLPDRGYLVSKTLAILVLVWISWMAVSLGLVRATRLEAVGAALLTVVLSVLTGYVQRTQLIGFLRERWRLLAIEEGVFWGALLVDVYIRALDPDLWHPALGGEKPMDLAYLNAAIKSPIYPPYDPWFAGGYMNYYYFGQIIVGTLIKISGIVPTTAYNLAVPLLFALTIGGAFTAAFALIERGNARPGRLVVGGGLLAALMVGVLGNLGGFLQLAGELEQLTALQPQTGFAVLDSAIRFLVGLATLVIGRQPLVIPQDWFWSSTRMLALLNLQGTGSINEFPFFTFLFADLHAHLIGLPLTLLAIALCVNFVKAERGRGSERGGDDDRATRLAPVAGGATETWPARTFALDLAPPNVRVSASTVAGLGVAGLVIGALYPTNSWDYPTYLGLVALSLAIPWYLAERVTWRGLATVVAQVAVVGLLSQLLYRPFYAAFQSFYSGVHFTDEKSDIRWYVMINGLFLAIMLSYFLLEAWSSYRRSGVLRATGLYVRRWDSLPRILQLQRVLVRRQNVGELLVIYGALGVAAVAVVAYLLGLQLIAFLFVFLALALTFGLRRDRTPEDCLMLLMFATGIAISIGTDIFAIDGDVGRMNTIFKFYEQVWVLFGIASAVALVRLGDHLAGLRVAWLRRIWIGALIVLFAMAAIYPVLGTKSRVSDRFDNTIPPTLDGTAYMDHAVYVDSDDQTHLTAQIQLATDKQAMLWLEDNVVGTPTILEANRPLYRWGSRFAIYTGLPTVLGWDWHQRQQRWGLQYEIDQRLNDVKTMYTDPSVDRTLSLLRSYNVTYIILGQQEQAFYPTARAKFDTMVGTSLSVAYDQNGVRIYQVK